MVLNIFACFFFNHHFEPYIGFLLCSIIFHSESTSFSIQITIRLHHIGMLRLRLKHCIGIANMHDSCICLTTITCKNTMQHSITFQKHISYGNILSAISIILSALANILTARYSAKKRSQKNFTQLVYLN